jgi:hypothetical protein
MPASNRTQIKYANILFANEPVVFFFMSIPWVAPIPSHFQANFNFDEHITCPLSLHVMLYAERQERLMFFLENTNALFILRSAQNKFFLANDFP